MTDREDFDVPSLTEQLAGTPWPAIIHYAYWLGVKRARVAELDRLAREAITPDRCIALRDECARAANALLAKLKAELAKERQP
ncbi:MAG TPA: hypothetical protein VFN79_17940 [Steroidobacteraceae bacterium]|nr:hypothetical protein [Steroidobacteraceae bacterium]